MALEYFLPLACLALFTVILLAGIVLSDRLERRQRKAKDRSAFPGFDESRHVLISPDQAIPKGSFLVTLDGVTETNISRLLDGKISLQEFYESESDRYELAADRQGRKLDREVDQRLRRREFRRVK